MTRRRSPTSPLTPLLTTLLAVGGPSSAQASPRVTTCDEGIPCSIQDRRQEYERLRSKAEGDLLRLWRLHVWCDAFGMERESRSVLRAILKLDPSDRKARELLGHVFYDGRWFTSEAKVEQFRRSQLEEEARRSGMAIHEGRLVDPADLPFLEKGMVRGPDGRWTDAEHQRKLAEGWILQDLQWIPPGEAVQVEEGLWKCGERWMTLPEADAYHADLARPWRIPGQHFLLHTTLPRSLALRALREANRARAEVVRALGEEPKQRLPLVVVHDATSFRRIAEGEEGARNEQQGLAACHGAYLAVGSAPPLGEGVAPVGVALWETATAAGEGFGPTHVRHAAAQSAIAALQAAHQENGAETKRKARSAVETIPEWMRFGVAVYAERYLIDAWVEAGGDPQWLRRWSANNIANKGGLEPLERILAFELDRRECTRTSKMLNQAGLVVAFLLDGSVPEVHAAHAEWVEAYRGGGDLPAASRALEAALLQHEEALRSFAGI